MEARDLEAIELIRLAHLWALLHPQESYYNEGNNRVDVADGRPYFRIGPVLDALGIPKNRAQDNLASREWYIVYRWMYGHD